MKNIFLILFCFASLPVMADRINTGNQYPCKTIAHAIAMAKNGDSIFVSPGTYFEKNLIIDKSIYLQGLDYPVLDGENKYEIISVKADKVTVNGFILQHSGVSSITDFAGIKVYNRRNVAIINNQLKDCFFGVYIQNGNHCLVENNSLSAYKTEEQQSGNGIHCWKSDSLCIISNYITGHRDGIYFEFVTNSIIHKNASFKNLRYGLHFMFSNDDTYMDNLFGNNGAGVAVMFSHGIKMYRNCFKENWGDAAYGILLKEISDSRIEYNYFEKNTTAIYSEGASCVQLRKNVFKENGWAIKIQASCMDIDIRRNNFVGNSFDIGTNGSSVLNNFNNNYWDKYDGYDLNRDGIGDVPYRPISMYSMIVEKNPSVMMLFHSVITSLMDKSEKLIPSLTPENLKDEFPLMKALKL